MNAMDLAILWDMDGTLLDTRACHYMTWRDVLLKHGYSLSEAVFDEHFGRNNASILPIYLGFEPAPELAKELISEKEALYREAAPAKVHLFPGVESWLQTAQFLGIRQAIASSGSLENIRMMADVFGLSPYFNETISGAELPAKPEPDVFLVAAKALGVPPEKCLVVEDSIPGINAAINAGMKSIALTSTNPASRLSEADEIVNDFTAPLQGYLDKLFS
ncbi:MAG: HAD family phosphatase [Anaerolineaceae bacterium]|nr:HAD family phosphatase [Anaerolineaceae bacterium]